MFNISWCWHKWEYFYRDNTKADLRVVAYFGEHDRAIRRKVCCKCGKHYEKVDLLFGHSDWYKSFPLTKKLEDK